MEKRGGFFVFEGIECAGKSTQTKNVAEKLNRLGYKVLTTREPGGTETGEVIRRLLLDPKQKNVMDPMTNLLLHNAARRQSVKEAIEPNRAKGVIVLSDRCFLSTLAYQCFAEGLDIDFAKQICWAAMGDCLPDKIFLLDIGLGEMQRRLAGRGNAAADRYDGADISFHEKIRNGYLTLSEQYPDLIAKIGAEGAPEDVSIELLCEIVLMMDRKNKLLTKEA